METAAQPTVFSFQFHNSAEHKIRTLLHEDGSIWFVAKDACEILEMGTEQIRRLDDDEKGLRKVPTPGGKQSLAVINESGLYTLVLRSNKPQAKPFRKWITAEVLPTIRKTGSYSFVTQSQGPATSKEVVAFLQTTTSAFWMVNEALLQCRVIEGEMRRAKKAIAAIMRSSREVFPVAKEILDDITSNAWQDLPGGKMLEVERHNSGY